MSGKKDDAGKAPVVAGCFAYFPRALRYVAEVSKFGVQKYNVDYADKNWERVEKGLERYTDALGRHLVDEAGGEMCAADSGLLHAGHAAWNALARLELLLRDEPLTPKNDERPWVRFYSPVSYEYFSAWIRAGHDLEWATEVGLGRHWSFEVHPDDVVGPGPQHEPAYYRTLRKGARIREVKGE